ncbi:MAG: tRNA preQ1(34) S-adenosylmethionine ribosyltransferase-isomerase QueA, partial [Chlamydiia bacterium]|nr:tRNA preQ1(34) S-adenosylmethionine ribosyltransferase-isomerase QueA [Chlamydiia bacterium]
MDLTDIRAYHFDLPEDLIAQAPCPQRDGSRLLVLDRAKQDIYELGFRDLLDILGAGDSLVLNNTKVLPARLRGERPQGGQSEILLLRPMQDGTWEAMARPGKKLRPGMEVRVGDDLLVIIRDTLPNGHKVVELRTSLPLEAALNLYGEMPLPPYIKREGRQAEDSSRYQTVFARELGAVAAPTAGLHFTQDMLDKLRQQEVKIQEVTLHVGPGTFRPVQVDNILDHAMHSESYIVSEAAAMQLNQRSPQGKQICVGTTCCRTLESAASEDGVIQAGQGDTQLFIYPGYRFRYVQHLLTNFHLPGSTLLMLVSAFAGYELTMEAYKKAVKD